MHLIAYKSDYSEPLTKIGDTLLDIRRQSKANNPKRQVSGVLIYDSGKFIQVLEGEESELRMLMKTIVKDARHTNISYLVDSQIREKSFSE